MKRLCILACRCKARLQNCKRGLSLMSQKRQLAPMSFSTQQIQGGCDKNHVWMPSIAEGISSSQFSTCLFILQSSCYPNEDSLASLASLNVFLGSTVPLVSLEFLQCSFQNPQGCSGFFRVPLDSLRILAKAFLGFPRAPRIPQGLSLFDQPYLESWD